MNVLNVSMVVVLTTLGYVMVTQIVLMAAMKQQNFAAIQLPSVQLTSQQRELQVGKCFGTVFENEKCNFQEFV